MDDIKHNIIDVDVIMSAEKRRTCAWYNIHSSYFEAILKVAQMQQFYLEHVTAFIRWTDKVWREYTDSYYAWIFFIVIFISIMRTS